MSVDYSEINKEIKSVLGKFYKEIPSTMESFGALTQAASKDGAVSAKHKELIALAIGISKQCEDCIAMHTDKLIKLNATREEILETVSVAIFMGGGPALMYAAKAIKCFDQLNK